MPKLNQGTLGHMHQDKMGSAPAFSRMADMVQEWLWGVVRGRQRQDARDACHIVIILMIRDEKTLIVNMLCFVYFLLGCAK